jgi:hypothetical protein
VKQTHVYRVQNQRTHATTATVGDFGHRHPDQATGQEVAFQGHDGDVPVSRISDHRTSSPRTPFASVGRRELMAARRRLA